MFPAFVGCSQVDWEQGHASAGKGCAHSSCNPHVSVALMKWTVSESARKIAGFMGFSAAGRAETKEGFRTCTGTRKQVPCGHASSVTGA